MEPVAIISFTRRGDALAHRIAELLKQDGEDAVCVSKCRHAESYTPVPLAEFTGACFEKQQGMIFVGAAGIAVRSIAPYVKDKLRDPFVIVMDEGGQYVIPILSGHIGRANEYARRLAAFCGAQAVITTATDVNGCFAADLFAQKNNCAIGNREGIVQVSSAVLEKKQIKVRWQDRYAVLSPEGNVLRTGHFAEDGCSTGKRREGQADCSLADIIISPFESDRGKGTLWLIPRCICVGSGCRRGKTADEILSVIQECLKEHQTAPQAVCELASIDRKKDEEGLIQAARAFGTELITFSEEELRQVPGTFQGSDFVRQTVGIDNVCARAAVAASQGTLIADKYAKNGVTAAIAQRKWGISFEK